MVNYVKKHKESNKPITWSFHILKSFFFFNCNQLNIRFYLLNKIVGSTNTFSPVSSHPHPAPAFLHFRAKFQVENYHLQREVYRCLRWVEGISENENLKLLHPYPGKHILHSSRPHLQALRATVLLSQPNHTCNKCSFFMSIVQKYYITNKIIKKSEIQLSNQTFALTTSCRRN